MSENGLLNSPEQDKLILELYGIAQRVAEEWVPRQRRDDLVHEFILRCIEGLRWGGWTTPELPLDRFVEIAILTAKTNGYRSEKRDAIRDRRHLDMIEQAPREWMSQELSVEEQRLRDFAAQVRSTLPRRVVRAHLLHRDDGLTYAQVARKMKTTPSFVQTAVKKVHARFRSELPAIGIEPPVSTHGGRPRRSARRKSVSAKRAA
jgi:DNA-directed RNA polymerase specialized sigma24 family protein